MQLFGVRSDRLAHVLGLCVSVGGVTEVLLCGVKARVSAAVPAGRARVPLLGV